MLSAVDNELLTRTGTGTPMGDLFRRFWLPVLLSRELPEPDGPPLRVKVLGENYHGQTWVPITDESCWVYCYTWNPERPLTTEECLRLAAGHSVHAQVDERWVPIRNRDNDYLIDRVDQKLRTFTGIRGVSEQDACIQDSQGFIADRTREHLGPTDAAIIQFRRLMLQSAREVRAGVAPPAAASGAAYNVRSGSAVAPGTMSFAEVMDGRFGDVVGRVSRAVR